jgi:type II secretory ATPase GspE/PulE/Tfp pilus assembly ATPase PilB-like protein
LLPEQVEIETLLAGESEIDRAIDQYYGYELSIDGILHEIETGEIDWKSLSATDDEYSQPVVRLIDSILTDAVKRELSDIHFEPEANFLRIRYRIDGMLRQIRALHKSYWPAMTVRIKVLSGMNIAEMRAPQDGRISLTVSGRQVDFRVCLPADHPRRKHRPAYSRPPEGYRAAGKSRAGRGSPAPASS